MTNRNPHNTEYVANLIAKIDAEIEENGKTCKVCGKKFIPLYHNEVSCSASCKRKAKKEMDSHLYKKIRALKTRNGFKAKFKKQAESATGKPHTCHTPTLCLRIPHTINPITQEGDN